ncbi:MULTISPECIES: hypothetical protein [unclassified Mesorhizobium]|uniref:hypothetical protein n=1 Tax=unclassified Mesorhizobium TaxID=325217 RepID=UPI003339CE08
MMTEMAVAMPLMLAGEQGLFHIPTPEEVRLQPISRAGNEADWPFSVDEGVLACTWSAGQRVVTFMENRPADLEEGEKFERRYVIVTTEPMTLSVGNMAYRDLFRPVASIEERIRLVAPFVTMGQRLCDQPAGARVGHGEL